MLCSCTVRHGKVGLQCKRKVYPCIQTASSHQTCPRRNTEVPSGFPFFPSPRRQPRGIPDFSQKCWVLPRIPACGGRHTAAKDSQNTCIYHRKKDWRVETRYSALPTPSSVTNYQILFVFFHSIVASLYTVQRSGGFRAHCFTTQFHVNPPLPTPSYHTPLFSPSNRLVRAFICSVLSHEIPIVLSVQKHSQPLPKAALLVTGHVHCLGSQANASISRLPSLCMLKCCIVRSMYIRLQVSILCAVSVCTEYPSTICPVAH